MCRALVRSQADQTACAPLPQPMPRSISEQISRILLQTFRLSVSVRREPNPSPLHPPNHRPRPNLQSCVSFSCDRMECRSLRSLPRVQAATLSSPLPRVLSALLALPPPSHSRTQTHRSSAASAWPQAAPRILRRSQILERPPRRAAAYCPPPCLSPPLWHLRGRAGLRAQGNGYLRAKREICKCQKQDRQRDGGEWRGTGAPETHEADWRASVPWDGVVFGQGRRAGGVSGRVRNARRIRPEQVQTHTGRGCDDKLGQTRPAERGADAERTRLNVGTTMSACLSPAHSHLLSDFVAWGLGHWARDRSVRAL